MRKVCRISTSFPQNHTEDCRDPHGQAGTPTRDPSGGGTAPVPSPALGVPPAQHLPPHLFLDLNYRLFGGTKPSEEPGRASALQSCHHRGQGWGQGQHGGDVAGQLPPQLGTQRSCHHFHSDRHRHMHGRSWEHPQGSPKATGMGSSTETPPEQRLAGHGELSFATVPCSRQSQDIPPSPLLQPRGTHPTSMGRSLWDSPGKGQPQGTSVGDPGSAGPGQGAAPLGTPRGKGVGQGGQSAALTPWGWRGEDRKSTL